MSTATRLKPSLLWDIFCKVIDNFGDLGVCWRLAQNLAVRGQQVRLWVDDASALRWMAPQGCASVEVRTWSEPLPLQGVVAGDVLVEAFGCEVAPEFLARYARQANSGDKQSVWINLEYLSAETYVERSHGLLSPVLTGPGAGLRKYFYYPGFTQSTGGLLREPDLLERQSRFDRNAWLQQNIPQWRPEEQLISLFCYEPPALQTWLLQLARAPMPTRLAVTTGRASEAVKTATNALDTEQTGWNAQGRLGMSFLPQLSQHEFDHLLWASDINFVRGEDSLVRSLWAGKAAIWHIYPQEDGVHSDKLDAYLLSVIQASDDLRQFHRFWNGLGQAAAAPMPSKFWDEPMRQARERLLKQPDLATQLLDFVASRRA